MERETYVDLHCHPALKPYGQSFPDFGNSDIHKAINSIWHQKPPGLKTKLFNIVSTLTKFTQTDFKTLEEGNVLIISGSISPIERGFFISRYGTGKTADLAANLVTGIGKRKVNFIQGNLDYYSELKKEYEFYRQLHNKPVSINGRAYKYRLVKSFDEIKTNLKDHEIKTISVVLSIEGAHVFNQNNEQPLDRKQILENVRAIKNWDHKIIFISPAHHFYNEIAGHCYSLSSAIRKVLNQDYGVNSGFTSIGKEVLNLLLDKTKGHRILIDIKHLSRRSRREYYQLLDSDTYKNEKIPVIASHAAVNGYESVYTDDELDEENGKFFGGDVNIFDDEIVRIARSEGLFCLQLDERRTSSKSERKSGGWNINRKKMLRNRAGFIWNQLEHIARILDQAGLDAWDTVAIGSDFDGMVDPLNGYWTSKEFSLLKENLKFHINQFIYSSDNPLSQRNKQINADSILKKLFCDNAMRFLKDNW